MIYSEEQLLICKEIETGKHIAVNSVPGAGKTTLILTISTLYPDKNIVAITYNAALKTEVREKIKNKQLKNIEAHSYHSFAVKYYDPNTYHDMALQKIITLNKHPLPLPKIDILAIDEMQDCIHLYYAFVKKIIKNLGYQPTFLFLGDIYQDLYAFKQADRRYLTLASEIWSLAFTNLSLSISYRLTPQIASFVNECVLGYDRIKCYKPQGDNVIYIRENYSTTCKILLDNLLPLLKSKQIQASDIFVLAASTKHKLLKILENKFVLNGIDCYVSGDDTKLDADVIRRKCVFTSFCQSKGQEKKIVIIVGFDAGYYQYYARNENANQCTSALYVAMTRASQRLYLLQDKVGPLPFLRKSPEEMMKLNYITILPNKSMSFKEYIKKEPLLHMTTPTDMVKFLPMDLITTLTLLIKDLFIVEQPATISIDIPNKIYTNDNYEEVADLNGLIIPAMYEYKQQHHNTMLNYIHDNTTKSSFLKSAIDKIDEPKTIEEFTYLAVVYFSLRSKLYFKLEQIKNYNWLTEEMVDQVHNNMTILVNPQYEHDLIKTYDLYETGPVKISGVLDCIDGNIIYELKCTSELTLEHKLQLIIYQWLWSHQSHKNFKLFNIKTNELLRLEADDAIINKIINLLLIYKYQEKPKVSDAHFINQSLL